MAKDDEGQKRYQNWLEKAERAHNKAEVIVAKQRHGPIGKVELFFEGEFTKFGDLEVQHDPHG